MQDHIEKDQTTQLKTMQTPKSEKKKFFIGTSRPKKQCRSLTSHGHRGIWNNSATSMTRDTSPAHQIPKAQRFTDIEKERMNNSSFLSFQLRKQLDKGISFTKSVRKNHFVPRNKSFQPSSASYFKDTSLDYGKLYQMANPEMAQKLELVGHLIKSYQSVHSSKGPTIKKFANTHLLYLDHGRQMNYQPQITKNNPGVGKYTICPDKTRQNSPSFSFRKVLTRFNESNNSQPGPSSYNTICPKPHISQSINQKGTFQNSTRIFLKNPDNKTPGPGAYLFED